MFVVLDSDVCLVGKLGQQSQPPLQLARFSARHSSERPVSHIPRSGACIAHPLGNKSHKSGEKDAAYQLRGKKKVPSLAIFCMSFVRFYLLPVSLADCAVWSASRLCVLHHLLYLR